MSSTSTRRLGVALLGIGLFASSLTGACGAKKGALMLALYTDMKAPKDVSAVSVTISANGQIKHSAIGRITPLGDVIMPATLAIAEPDDESASIRIRVMAFQDKRPRVLRDVRTTIPHARTALLKLPLNFVNDKSAVGPDLPAEAAEVDFVGTYRPPCPDVENQTIIDGECQNNYVDSSTLPDFDGDRIGPSTDESACFDVAKCLGNAAPVEDLDRAACSIPRPSDATTNLALVTPDTGECIRPGECLVPIDPGPGGWLPAGDRIVLPRFVCRLLERDTIRLVRSTGVCGSKNPDAAICTPKANDPNIGCGVATEDATGATQASKVDVLFVVDNSAAMGDKSALLAQSIRPLLEKAATTNDVHVGVISTSLGSFGGDVCSASNPRTNDRGHLSIARLGGGVVESAQPSGVLKFGAMAGGTTSFESFLNDASALIAGIDQTGCGLEAQLESAYHFLTAPDPWEQVKLNGFNQAEYVGIDTDLLRQRADFLRADSLVVVVMVTDEDDSSVDPLSIGGQGWAFMANQFPGSQTLRPDGKGTTAPRPTSRCASDPLSPDCTSCAFGATCDASKPECQKIKNDAACNANGGYYGPTEDPLNVRFHRMKERFGIDPQFPISRYAEALTKKNVSMRSDEHAITVNAGRTEIAAYCPRASCTNPLFAATLPRNPTDDFCKLPPGPRGKELVVFALLGGVPPALAHGTPDWTKILGANPDRFDFTGIDPHMIQSVAPRQGLPPPSDIRGDRGADPVHGREWNTSGEDLQYACTFPLPMPRTCSSQDPSCDCAAASKNPPVCGAQVGQQESAKAYPTVRELRLAKALGDRAFVASVCSATALGYTPVMSALAERLSARLTP